MYCSEVTETAQAAAGPERTAASPCAGPGLDVAAALIQLAAVVQGIYARVSEQHDLTPVQAKLLCVLLDGPRGMAQRGAASAWRGPP